MIKNKILISILFLCMILIILFSLNGCNNQKNSNEDIKEKVIKELDYLDTQIISILNKLNNITLQDYNVTSEEISLDKSDSSSGDSKISGEESGSQSESNQSGSQEDQNSNSQQKSNITVSQMEATTILESDQNDTDWNSIKTEIEKISNSWAIILLDISNFDIDNNDVLGFSNTLDSCILSIKDENKKDSLINLAKLYSFIPKYEVSISAPNSIQNIKQAKSYIINAYSAVEQDNWDVVESNMSECEKTYKNIINDIEYVKDKEIKVNKTYVLIKELRNSLSHKDKKLFYIKYKNLIESINKL